MVHDNASSSSARWNSPGAGITGGYNGNSEGLREVIVFMSGLAMYNSCELIIMIFLTFHRYKGLYFWSLLISGAGIIPYSIGFLLKLMNITTGNLRWLSVVLITIGWWPMITGQALVLWSRLHLILHGSRGDRIIKWTMWMIIVDAIVLHIPTTVLTFGSNGHTDTPTFVYGYNIMEKIQMCGFFCQEVVLSSIYIIETVRILKSSLQPGTRKIMQQLLGINAIIIVMDLGLLGLEAASLYILETLVKGVIYSIKLKLEFAILGKLVNFVGGKAGSVSEETMRKGSVGFVQTHDRARDRGLDRGPDAIDEDMNLDEFVDLSKTRTDVAHPSRASNSVTRRTKGRNQASDFEFDFARFEHVEDITSLDERSLPSEPSESNIQIPNGHV